MSIDRALLKWDGWGWANHRYDLHGHDESFFAWLGRRFARDVSRPSQPAVTLDAIALPTPRGDADLPARLGAVVGAGGVKTDRLERVAHAYGKSLHDLLRVRRGEFASAPDAVVYPETAEQVAALLALARHQGFALVPYGGGSSVVGGVEASDPRGRAVVTLDTTRLNRRLALDPQSQLACFEAGVYGPQLERSLGVDGWTLGHFPQSFEFSTLGGWIAARSSGQQSNRFGRIEQLLLCARVATPEGELATWRGPASAAGPDLNAIIAGSEGTLGVIVDATLRIERAPETHDIRAVFFPCFSAGTRALRAICQAGLALSFLRLSDAEETELYLQLSGARKLEQLGLAALARFGYGAERAVMLVGTDGSRAKVSREVGEALAICKKHGGLHLGRGPAKNWHRDRFEHPYLRDTLLDHGVAIDTLETATTWDNVDRLWVGVREALREAMERQGFKGVVTAHLSHSYPTGSSLYFIFFYPTDARAPVEQWWELKRAASDAVRRLGGTISHHHGVGLDHQPWMAEEKGQVGMAALQALKARLDPDGVMNPGKLVGKQA